MTRGAVWAALLLLVLAAAARHGAEERACRLSWQDDITEYAVLAEVCRDSDAREALLLGAP